MAKKKTKTKDVAKFGGVEQLGTVRTDLHSPLKGDNYDASSVEAQSTTKLEHDVGHGEPLIIRRFTFGLNPEKFLERPPTKQDIFNAHIKGIEMALFADGMKIFDEAQPRITFDMNKKQYDIFITARARKGYLIQERPQTLSEVAHG